MSLLDGFLFAGQTDILSAAGFLTLSSSLLALNFNLPFLLLRSYVLVVIKSSQSRIFSLLLNPELLH